MARQKRMRFKGRRGNISFYSWKEIDCARENRKNTRQTKATKECSASFSVTARMAKSFRELFAPLILFGKDRQMQLAWTGALQRWMHSRANAQLADNSDTRYITSFQFHIDSNLHDRLHVPVSLALKPGELITVNLPAFVPKESIGAPAYTREVTMKIAVASASLMDGSAIGSSATEINIPYNSHLYPS
ncbi:hypothetical protein [Aridibaculum aurantiacum]|uniref:hypothetical protein n=1 Tax=Aridibaculum aurantiacum TaxID=2810307 RepID=UPI001A9738AE|nr:hypothetical protein [Aridibaculum aurantiacum]